MKEKNYLINFLKYMKFAKKEFITGFIFVIIGIFTEIFSVKLIANVFDEKLELIDKNMVFYVALKLALIYLFVKLLETFTIILRKYFLIKASNIIHYNIQKMVYDHVTSLPIEYFDNMPAGSVLSRITSDVNYIRTFFRTTVIDSIVTISKIILMYVIMLYVDYRLSLLILIFIPAIYVIQRLNTVLGYKYISSTRAENSICTGISNEICQNLEVVKAFNNEDKILDNWEVHAKKRLKLNYAFTNIRAFLQHNIFDLLKYFVNLTIIFYYIYSEYNNLGLITVTNVLLFIFYATYILNDITNLTINMSTYTTAKGCAKNLYELLNLKVEDKKAKIKLEDFHADIRFEDVSFAYKNDDYILKNVNIDIKENETVAFVGHTGSGKSTIMNLLIKFYENQKGNIYISGVNLKDLENEFIRSKMAIVLQDSFLFEGTLLSNVCYDENYARKCLETVGAKYILDERGIDEKVLVDATNFSTGEKQLISFARALAKNPKILILDEATANVDSKTEQRIQKGIEVLSKNRTTLIIAHRLSTIKNADKIYVLDKGEIVEQGNHESLVKLNGVYKKMLERDIKNEE